MLHAIRILGVATSVPGQRCFLQSIQKGSCQNGNKSLHFSGKPKKQPVGTVSLGR